MPGWLLRLLVRSSNGDSMSIPLILDVDTGVDDAMAVALAVGLETHHLLAITTVAGNVPVDLATRNTLRVLEWLDADVPVYRGMSQPLVRPLHTATSVHGNDGLGGWNLPDARTSIAEMTAPEAIVRLAREHKGAIDAAFVGPLTNLAVALALEPDLVNWFRRVTIMGGAFFNPGNETPAAEFNIFVDPEAAGVVARSGLPATWIGLDVTHQTALVRDEWTTLERSKASPAQLAWHVSRQSFIERAKEHVYLHDPLAVAVASNPDLVTCLTAQVLVETGHLARGETRLAVGHGNAAVAECVSSDAFMAMFRKALTI